MLQKALLKFEMSILLNIVILKLVKTRTKFKYLIGYLDKAIRPLVLIMPKMSGYAKTLKVKEGDNIFPYR